MVNLEQAPGSDNRPFATKLQEALGTELFNQPEVMRYVYKASFTNIQSLTKKIDSLKQELDQTKDETEKENVKKKWVDEITRDIKETLENIKG